MGFMDKVKAAAQDISVEAKKATAQGKEKIDEMQTKKKMDDAARRLGYLIFRERAEGTPAGSDAETLVAEITELQKKLAAERDEAVPTQANTPVETGGTGGGTTPTETPPASPQQPAHDPQHEPPGGTQA